MCRPENNLLEWVFFSGSGGGIKWTTEHVLLTPLTEAILKDIFLTLINSGSVNLNLDMFPCILTQSPT